MRIRPWVIGATFVAFGVACHAAFKADPLPIRTQFACFEFFLYAIGLGLCLFSIVSTPMSRAWKLTWAVLWVVAVLASLVALIDSLPS